ncbi:hypothetical protein F6X68_03675 [Micromonospora sp. AMSO12t]|uniref:hypothetical protein n=1 Tax=Micromonospora sp. AMSO12t TaxID=2650410 RepID=UPI00124B8500|nr:hypothetical protein [Micromonospora sp. AMSO12t]KAB1161585.1 hypothetical protein F6X68_03675 [Micromonospora sp. AMSO12t]
MIDRQLLSSDLREQAESGSRARLAVAQLADESSRDDVLTVADLYALGQDFGKVAADEHVSHLAARLCMDSGLAERADWEHVWVDPEWGASPADIYVGFLAETTNRSTSPTRRSRRGARREPPGPQDEGVTDWPPSSVGDDHARPTVGS